MIRTESEQRPGALETYRVVGVIASGFYYGSDRTAGVDVMVPSPAPIRVYMLRLRAGISPPARAHRAVRIQQGARRDAKNASWLLFLKFQPLGRSRTGLARFRAILRLARPPRLP